MGNTNMVFFLIISFLLNIIAAMLVFGVLN